MDAKVSSLTSAATLNSGDYLLLVQAGNSLKVDLQTFFTHIPVKTVITEASESPASGAISTSLKVSKIAIAATPIAYTLAAGTHGMTKTIVCSSTSGTSPTSVITVTSGAGVSTISFNAVGDSVTLSNVDGLWYVTGSNSVTIA
jgi:hypothetical protein